MSDIIGSLRAMLLEDTALTAQVPATRIVAGELPQDVVFPAIVLMHQFTRRHGNQAIGQGTELLETALTVQTPAAGYAQMASLVALVEVACHGKRGTYNGIVVQQCLRVETGEDFFLDEMGLWVRPIVIQLIYTRP